MTQLIPLTQGQFAIVDDEDFEELSQFKWHARRTETTFYGKRTINSVDKNGRRCQRAEFIHQIIARKMGFSRPDHRDRNGLNNTRENIRPATHRENLRNRPKPLTNTSGYKGVTRVYQRDAWAAIIGVDGVRKRLGYFKDPEDAARAYDEAARILHGEFACLNFPNEEQSA